MWVALEKLGFTRGIGVTNRRMLKKSLIAIGVCGLEGLGEEGGETFAADSKKFGLTVTKTRIGITAIRITTAGILIGIAFSVTTGTIRGTIKVILSLGDVAIAIETAVGPPIHTVLTDGTIGIVAIPKSVPIIVGVVIAGQLRGPFTITNPRTPIVGTVLVSVAIVVDAIRTIPCALRTAIGFTCTGRIRTIDKAITIIIIPVIAMA